MAVLDAAYELLNLGDKAGGIYPVEQHLDTAACLKGGAGLGMAGVERKADGRIEGS